MCSSDLQYQATTTEQFAVTRQLIKYLTTKGFFWKASTKRNKLVIEEDVTAEVPLLNVEKYLEQHV